jgi:uncharacterized membrane protein
MSTRELRGTHYATGAIRLARSALAAHILLIAFSTVALTTIVAGPLPVSLQTGIPAEIYRLGWRFSGPTYVVLGAAAALLHATGHLGWRRASGMFVAACLLSLAAELLGTTTGMPFGAYQYTTLLGYRIGGHVPFPIPLSWFFMIYSALAISGCVLPGRNDGRTRVLWAAVAGLILTAWDVAMDPAMSNATKHWIWAAPGAYFGMPLTNWLGWWATGSLIALAMLVITPPALWRREVSPSRLPLALYAINGVLPIALCARHGLWGASVLGALAMGIPLVLALRAPLRHLPVRIEEPGAGERPWAAADTAIRQPVMP